jgi:transcriptional antiterminator NusG
MVRNTPMVTGFLGSSGGGAKPVPLPEEEIAPILKLCGITTEKTFAGKVGDKVRIGAGTFTGQEGVIDTIDYQKGTLTVLIYAFGRATPTELTFNEVLLL